MDIVVTIPNVQGCEYDLPVQLLQYLFDAGHGVYIPLRPTVYCSVVLYGSEGAILFLNEEEGRSSW